jgi:exosortase F-associated protein
MQIKINSSNILWIAFLVILLISIRIFENQLFYDPFLDYFKGEYTNLPIPKIIVLKLFFSLGIRYYLNSVLSLGLLYLIFSESQMVKFSILLFMVLGSFLMISFFFTLNFFGEENKMLLFYIRRFLIQPIFILLFIPGFYYQKRTK